MHYALKSFQGLHLADWLVVTHAKEDPTLPDDWSWNVALKNKRERVGRQLEIPHGNAAEDGLCVFARPPQRGKGR